MERSPERWARIFAEAYGATATPPLSQADQDRLGSELATHLAPPIAIETEMSARANLVLNRWERRAGGEGLRVISIDMLTGAVKMGRRLHL